MCVLYVMHVRVFFKRSLVYLYVSIYFSLYAYSHYMDLNIRFYVHYTWNVLKNLDLRGLKGVAVKMDTREIRSI